MTCSFKEPTLSWTDLAGYALRRGVSDPKVIAQLAGVTTRTAWRWKTKNRIPVEGAERAADGFGANPRWIWGGAYDVALEREPRSKR